MTDIITAARPLEGKFATPPAADALRPSPATLGLVRGQVQALLTSSPAFHALPAEDRRKVAHDLVRISAYTAECMRDVCWQSERLGQTPVVRRSAPATAQEAPVAQAQEVGKFKPSAANQIARITQQTLRAIAFPTFVADLIKGTFNAIVQTSIQQMEAFVKLVGNVGKTVDQFMEENISDNQARDWLAQSYPDHIRVQDGKAVPRDGADERKPPDLSGLGLEGGVSIDEGSLEEKLVPAARRKLAETRLQMLSTLVLMGVNRIVITGGKIRATMAFHIDTTDRAHEELATDLDTRAAASASFGFGPWSASASMSVSYVRSTRASSDAEINTDTDLTGEVELHFKSDYFPVERFANAGALGKIQQNTAAPEANAPFSSPPPVGGDAPRHASRRSPKQAPSLSPAGTPLPPPKMPEKPTQPDKPAPAAAKADKATPEAAPAAG
ncbi:MAG: hypothetical protein ABUT39_28305 [Acidobacteriota bacterium]